MELKDWCFLMVLLLTSVRTVLMVREEVGKLRCRTGVTLNIHPDGKVNGSKSDGGSFAVIRLRMENRKGVTLFGIHSQRYLCMTPKGKLRGEMEKTKHCYFHSIELPYHFTAFHGKGGNRKLFIGLTRSGKPRKGHLKNRRSHFTWSRKRTKRRHDKKFSLQKGSKDRKKFNLFIKELSRKNKL